MAPAKPKAASKVAAAKRAGAASASTPSKDMKKPATQDKVVLPPKDQAIFKEILAQYEQKQYRKGLKNCEILLNKYPDHGETLCMQGLFYHCLYDRDMAYKLVKQGVKQALGSHIVWHVYGIITRADRNYEEAMKCYAQAHRIDPENMHILRDLALLQAQVHQYPAYVLSRHLLLRMNPKARLPWIGLAVAYALNSQYTAALDVLLALEDLEAEVPARCYEVSEALLFAVKMARKAGKNEWALEYLEARKDKVVDGTAWRTARAELLGELGKTEAAEWAWADLVRQNPECQAFILGLLKTKGLVLSKTSTEEERAASLNAVQELSSRHPKSLALRRLVLDLASGPLFQSAAEEYVRSGLVRGIPSLFVDLKALCRDSIKGPVIGQLVEGFRSQLEAGQNLSNGLEGDEPTSTYLWTLYFLSHYYSSLSRHTEALDTIRLAISHTPTLPELHMTLARILKRVGASSAAAAAMVYACFLDGQDRFLNSKGAKYLLRVGEVDRARRLVGRFTRQEAPSPLEDLVEMQALWFIMEEAEAARAKGRLNVAMKRYHQINEIFSTWVEDQFDFHTYCLRKSTLSIYTELVKFEDGIYAHPHLLRASRGAVELYCQLHDGTIPTPTTNGVNATNGSGAAAEGDDTSRAPEEGKDGSESAAGEGMSKKALKKAKIAEAKAKAQAAADAKKAAAAPPPKEVELPSPPKDTDPDGDLLMRSSDPLGDAAKFIKPLQTMAHKEPYTWLLSFEIAIRKNKPLVALKHLRQAHLLRPDNIRLHPACARLKHHLSLEGAPDTVRKAVERGLAEIWPYATVAEANAALLKDHAKSPAHALAAAEAARLVGAEASEVEGPAFLLLEPETPASWRSAAEALDLLRSAGSSRTEEYLEKARARWELAEVFWPEDRRVQAADELRTSQEEGAKDTEASAAGEDAGHDP